MSCSCCCYVSPTGTRKERLVHGGVAEVEGGEEEESRRNMDISLLREQYRSTKERQRRHTQVLLLRTVSEQLSESVNIVPVTQGLTSPWEPSSGPLPVLTFDLDPMSYDPWHVHLGLHKRLCPGAIAQLTASSVEMTSALCSSRRWSSSTDAISSHLDVESTSESLSSSRNTSPLHPTKDLDNADPGSESPHRSRGDPGPESPHRSRGDPGSESPHRSREDPGSESPNRSRGDRGSGPCNGPPEESCPNRASVWEPAPGHRSKQTPRGSFTSSDESATPVASVTGSTISIHEDLKETATWRGSRRFVAPSLRLTRQLSVGGLGSPSTGGHQALSYQPFPNRKTPRISEAAKRLGMYSSF
ncbi:TRIO and F-actin-binding protein-like [Antennarius striatus]|uniref:TRIO and F-actin-binding protein-like n=1 Tax=Antennarius striatus TaxID=241820 RepID=UPI0035B39553